MTSYGGNMDFKIKGLSFIVGTWIFAFLQAYSGLPTLGVDPVSFAVGATLTVFGLVLTKQVEWW